MVETMFLIAEQTYCVRMFRALGLSTVDMTRFLLALGLTCETLLESTEEDENVLQWN